MQEYIETVKKEIESAPVVIFMKGTPDFPQCGFSAKACQALKACGAKQLHAVDVLEQHQMREAIKAYTKWPTLPQVFIRGEFIGGCDIVCELASSGELEKMLLN